VAELRGVTLPDVGLRIIQGQETITSRQGSLLFAHFGLTGPVALDVSRFVSGHPQPSALHVQLDLLPGRAESEFDEDLRRESLQSGKKQLAGVLPEQFSRRVSERLLVLAGLAVDRKAAGLSKADRQTLVRTIKCWPARWDSRRRR
jgi:predicted flavoprotein YhiN